MDFHPLTHRSRTFSHAWKCLSSLSEDAQVRRRVYGTFFLLLACLLGFWSAGELGSRTERRVHETWGPSPELWKVLLLKLEHAPIQTVRLDPQTQELWISLPGASGGMRWISLGRGWEAVQKLLETLQGPALPSPKPSRKSPAHRPDPRFWSF